MSPDVRATEEAFAWVEDLVDGKIVERTPQVRWRPHWFLTVRDRRGDDHRVMLRGFRNGGYLGDETVTGRGSGERQACCEPCSRPK